MTTYNFIQFTGSTISFDPAVDVLHFGDDNYPYSSGANLVVIEAVPGTNDYKILRSDSYAILNAGGVATLTLSASAPWQPKTENFSFVDGSQILFATEDQPVLSGTDSNDQLVGLGVAATTLQGGAGDDTYVVDSVGDVVIEASNSGSDDAVRSSISYTLGANLEVLMLTGSAHLSGTGNESGNMLFGNAGNNILAGGGGRDMLDGGGGADTLVGGTGNDDYIVNSILDVVVEGKDAGRDRVFSEISYTLGANIEDLIFSLQEPENGGTSLSRSGVGNTLDNFMAGSFGNDLLRGLAGNDTLEGKSGKDTLEGGVGNDTYVFWEASSGSGASLVEKAGEGVDTVRFHYSGGNYVLGAYIENMTFEEKSYQGAASWTGNTLSNEIVSGGGNDRLEGLAGNDTLDGGSGQDTLIGGLGNDTYRVDQAGDIVIEADNAGIDTVHSAVSYTLGAALEHLTLTAAGLSGSGNALNNRLTGSTGSEVLDGGAGHDSLDGGAGADFLLGGTGNDTYWVDTSGDVVAEGAGAGIDTVRSSISYTLGANVERLVLSGSAAINGTGNGLSNVLRGNQGANVLAGGGGNDTVDGGDGGSDRLSGGAGQDTFVLRNNGIFWNYAGDLILDFVSGTDKLRYSASASELPGDHDAVVEGATEAAGPGGFAAGAELVILTGNISGAITASSAAAAIGSASSAYATGARVLFAVDNGVDSAVYLFTSAGQDAWVSAQELMPLATLQGVASTATGDYLFQVG